MIWGETHEQKHQRLKGVYNDYLTGVIRYALFPTKLTDGRTVWLQQYRERFIGGYSAWHSVYIVGSRYWIGHKVREVL